MFVDMSGRHQSQTGVEEVMYVLLRDAVGGRYQ